MNKTIAKVGFLGIVIFGITECQTVFAPAGFADYKVETQTIKTNLNLNLMEYSISASSFSRGTYEIITTQPWLKVENQSFMLSDKELIDILRSVGFSEGSLKMAWAIVKKESNGRPFAHNNNPKTGDNSYGLFQINMYRGLEKSRQEAYGLDSNEDLFDPVTNAKIAYKISNGGKSWGAWTTKESAQKIIKDFPY